MARDTLPRIRESALELFSERWLETVSVAEICRRAGVSNGVFYRYFTGKHELFVDLVDDFLDQFAADLRAVNGEDLSECIHSFVVTVTGAARRYAGQVTMFREGQYRDRHYEDRLRDVYVETVERLYGRRVSEVEYLYLLSGLRFLATRSLYHDISIDADLVCRLILNGVFQVAGGEEGGVACGARVEALDLTPPGEPDAAMGEGVRERMITAGMELFGRDGFHAVQVSDITRLAGCSVGTFYNHFETKESFLGEIVSEIGQRTRHYLSAQVEGIGSRWEREVIGMWCFVNYFSHHREYYEIVREAEFVVPESVRDYYDAFEHGYVENLVNHDASERRIVANFLMGLSHYTGIELIFTDRVQDSAAAVRELAQLLISGIPE